MAFLRPFRAQLLSVLRINSALPLLTVASRKPKVWQIGDCGTSPFGKAARRSRPLTALISSSEATCGSSEFASSLPWARRHLSWVRAQCRGRADGGPQAHRPRQASSPLPWRRAKSSGRAVVYLICSMAKAEETLEISMRAMSFL
jgi:hypothetical protein